VAIRAVIKWLEKVGRRIAAHKTEVVLPSSRKSVECMCVEVNGVEIASAETLKYLGVLIDRRLSFKAHARYASKKAALTTAALARIMPKVGVPRLPARRLLVAVSKATLLYSAPIWSCVTTTELRYCTDAVETAEHIILHCSRFVEERAQLVALAGSSFSPRGLVAAMMAEKIVWDGAHVIIVTMMKRVRKDELANRYYR